MLLNEYGLNPESTGELGRNAKVRHSCGLCIRHNLQLGVISPYKYIGVIMDYVISDLHIGHKRICSFEPVHRPFATLEEHDEEIVRRWNSVVTHEDRVYVLGDVHFRKESAQYTRRLNGNKILIMGNHDTYGTGTEYEEIFSRVLGCLEYNQCIMTHIPVHPSQLRRYKLNLHGHLHSKEILKHPLEGKFPDDLVDKRYVNCSAEHFNLTPTPLKELIESRLRHADI